MLTDTANRMRTSKGYCVVIDRSWRMARGVYNSDGLLALIWEIAYQCLKAPLRIYTNVVWRFYKWRRRRAFIVGGHRMSILTGDKGLSIELAVYGTHEPRASELVASCLRPGMTVVDIGANIGYYALIEARRVGPS